MAKKSGAAEAVAKQVRVHEVTRMAMSDLSPAAYNPKTISVSRLEQLKASIREHGFAQPVVVQKHSPQFGPNVMVAGHQRCRALREIAVEDGTEVPPVPVIVVDVDDRTAKKMNLAMRDKAELSEDLVGELLADLQAESPLTEGEVAVMGFEPEEFASYLDEPTTDEDGGEGRGPVPTTQAPSLKLDFSSVELRDQVKSAIGAKAKKDEPGGDALARVLGVRVKAKTAKR